jgi:hypothetical protein
MQQRSFAALPGALKLAVQRSSHWNCDAIVALSTLQVKRFGASTKRWVNVVGSSGKRRGQSDGAPLDFSTLVKGQYEMTGPNAGNPAHG